MGDVKVDGCCCCCCVNGVVLEGDSRGESKGDATCHNVGLVIKDDDDDEPLDVMLDMEEMEGCLLSLLGGSSPCNGGRG